MLMHLLLLCLAATAAKPHPVRVRSLDVMPAAFALGQLTIVCEFKDGDRGRSTRPSESSAATPVRCAMTLENNGTGGTWQSEWMDLPPRPGRGQPWALYVPALYPPDPSRASLVGDITLKVIVDDGSGRLRACRRSYYRWSDGLFHSFHEHSSTDGTSLAGFSSFQAPAMQLGGSFSSMQQIPLGGGLLGAPSGLLPPESVMLPMQGAAFGSTMGFMPANGFPPSMGVPSSMGFMPMMGDFSSFPYAPEFQMMDDLSFLPDPSVPIDTVDPQAMSLVPTEGDSNPEELRRIAEITTTEITLSSKPVIRTTWGALKAKYR